MLTSLPNETLEQVFQHLGASDISKCLLVNRRCHEIISKNRYRFKKKDAKIMRIWKMKEDVIVIGLEYSECFIHVEFHDIHIRIFIHYFQECNEDDDCDCLYDFEIYGSREKMQETRRKTENMALRLVELVAAKFGIPKSEITFDEEENPRQDSHLMESLTRRIPNSNQQHAFQSIYEMFVDQFSMQALELDNNSSDWVINLAAEILQNQRNKVKILRLNGFPDSSSVIEIQKKFEHECLHLLDRKRRDPGFHLSSKTFVEEILDKTDWKNLEAHRDLVSLETVHKLVEMCNNSTRSNIAFLVATPGQHDTRKEFGKYTLRLESLCDGIVWSFERPTDNRRIYIKEQLQFNRTIQPRDVTYFRVSDSFIAEELDYWRDNINFCC